MKQIGPITIPLDKVVQVNSYEDILNFVFDCKLSNKTDAFSILYKDKQPKILILTNGNKDVYATLAFMPPGEWKAYKGQELMLWVAPTLPRLYTFFSQWHFKVVNTTEKMALMMILQYIEILMKHEKEEKKGHYFY